MATHDLDIFSAARESFARHTWGSQRAQQRVRIILSTFVIVVGALLMLTPFAWLVSTSLKPEGDVFLVPIQWIPREVRWTNYIEALTFVPYGRYFLNSVEVTGLAVLGTVLSASLVAFAFARLRGPGKNVLFII